MHDISDQIHADEKLKGDLEFQKLVSKISIGFVGLSGAEFERAIYDALKEIGKYFKVDAVRLYRLSSQGEPLGFRTMWLSEHHAPEREQSEIDKKNYPGLGAHYSEGKTILFGSIDESPPWPEFREILNVFGTKAGLGVPLEFDGSVSEIFAMDRVQSECIWPEDIIERSRTIGHIILNAVRRKEMEIELKENLDLQNLIAKISARFVGPAAAETEENISYALMEVCKYFDVDGARLLQISMDGEVLETRAAWRSGHLTTAEDEGAIRKYKYPSWVTHYLRDGYIAFGRIEELPHMPEGVEIVGSLGLKAGVAVLLEAGSSVLDVFNLDKVKSECVWPKNIAERVRPIGRIILNAVRRREAEVELQGSLDKIKQLKLRIEHENIYLRQEVELNHKYKEIIGQSDAIKKVLNQVEQVAETDSSVLVLGETGTGKELLARAIHDISPRKGRPLVKVNCAALPSTLVESELFGREKGAYTGALSRQSGRFEVADGSTIFLDEICELPLELQAKLLRVLQDGQFERLGSSKTIEVDVRIIAATNRDIEKAVHEGNFREDLFYRLNVFPITVPPLRDRREDIPLLVWAFVEELGKTMGKTIEHIPQESMDMLHHYSWPGNIRELRNVIERAMIVSKGASLQIDISGIGESRTFSQGTLEEVEKTHIIEVLESVGWKVSGEKGAAKILGLNPKTLESRMKKLGISRQR